MRLKIFSDDSQVTSLKSHPTVNKKMNCRVGAASDDESEVAFEQPGSGSFELAGSGSGSFWMTVLGWAGWE